MQNLALNGSMSQNFLKFDPKFSKNFYENFRKSSTFGKRKGSKIGMWTKEIGTCNFGPLSNFKLHASTQTKPLGLNHDQTDHTTLPVGAMVHDNTKWLCYHRAIIIWLEIKFWVFPWLKQVEVKCSWYHLNKRMHTYTMATQFSSIIYRTICTKVHM